MRVRVAPRGKLEPQQFLFDFTLGGGLVARAVAVAGLFGGVVAGVVATVGQGPSDSLSARRSSSIFSAIRCLPRSSSTSVIFPSL